MSRRTGIAGNQMKIGDHLEAWREAGLVEGPPLLQATRELLGRAEVGVHLSSSSCWLLDLLATDTGSLLLSVSHCSSVDSQRWSLSCRGEKASGVGIRARGTGQQAAGRGAGGLARLSLLVSLVPSSCRQRSRQRVTLESTSIPPTTLRWPPTGVAARADGFPHAFSVGGLVPGGGGWWRCRCWCLLVCCLIVLYCYVWPLLS